MKRREFTRNQREQIVDRSKNAGGEICCEGCDLVLGAKPYEIDHTIPEALRPSADKKQPLTIADGQLLGKECCHRGPDGKTNRDIKQIAKGKRQYNRANGLKRPKQTIPSNNSLSAGKQPKFQKLALPPRQLYEQVSK